MFDPVGAGCSNFRRQAAQAILAQVQPAVLRGNASDVIVRRLAPDASRTLARGFLRSRQHLPAVESFSRCVEKWVKEHGNV